MKKKPVNYRLAAHIVAALDEASEISGVDKTEILETALGLYFGSAKGRKGLKKKGK
jgi:hypothetical protein